MFKSLNTAATGMQAQQTNMDVIANNLANVNTAGFKKSRAEFEDLLYQTQREPGSSAGLNAVTPTGVQTGLGVRTGATQKDFSLGSAIQTKNPFDLQIEGPGFFRLSTSDGGVAYTRDGSFKRDPSGRIVDKNGNLLQPTITVPADVAGVEISPTGLVQVIQGLNDAPRDVGQIELASFVNPAGLKSIGRNLYVQSPASGQPQIGNPGATGLGNVAQGQIEASNVSIVDEMVNMITAQRAYETNSKVIQASDQMLNAVNNMR